MARYVALLRAVNVAGHPRVATTDLAAAFTAAGASYVASFGHAGNFVFDASSAAAVAKEVAAAFGVAATTRNWSTVTRLAKLIGR